MCLLKGVLVHIVKVSSKTIEVYTQAGNREVGKAKSS